MLGPNVEMVVVVAVIPGSFMDVAARMIRCRRPAMLMLLLLMTATRLMFVVVRHSSVGDLSLLVLIMYMCVVCSWCRLVLLTVGMSRRWVHCLCLVWDSLGLGLISGGSVMLSIGWMLWLLAWCVGLLGWCLGSVCVLVFIGVLIWVLRVG